MLAFNFSLLAVLSYVAVIGATPLGAAAPVEAIGRRQGPPTISCEVSGLELPDYLACLYCDANPTDLYCEELCAYDEENPFCTPTSD